VHPTTNLARLDAGDTFTDSINLSTTNTTAFDFKMAGNNTTGAWLYGRKSRGTIATPTGITSGDGMTGLRAYGYNATSASYVEGGYIRFAADGTPGATDMPGKFEVRTTTAGNASPSLRMTIANDGKVTFENVYGTTVGATNRDLYIDNTGLIGYVASLEAAKTNIVDNDDVEWLKYLRPVTFRYRAKDADGNYTDQPDGPIQYGLIAEEVELINGEICFYDDTDNGPELRGISYQMLVTPLLALVQQQAALIADLQQRVEALEAGQ
jgi:hypothetical protein